MVGRPRSTIGPVCPPDDSPAPHGHRVVSDPASGYRRLDPVPEAAELQGFYESRYYDLLRAGDRAPDLRHLLAGGDESERERDWLHQSTYADVLDMLDRHAPGRRLLDVGAGTGEFVAAAAAAGFEARGIEPADEAASAARERGLGVETTDLAGFADSREDDATFDAVVLINVLEHVPDPAASMLLISSLLSEGGVVFVQVPNDFSRLQLIAQEKLGLPSWWIAVPDHVNYFSLESLPRFADGLGLRVLELSADFPMELFLLMGVDYVSDPAQGARCHAQRQELELSLDGETRRALYSALAREGMGRNVRAVLGA